jgi:hypothetical protein
MMSGLSGGHQRAPCIVMYSIGLHSVHRTKWEPSPNGYSKQNFQVKLTRVLWTNPARIYVVLISHVHFIGYEFFFNIFFFMRNTIRYKISIQVSTIISSKCSVVCAQIPQTLLSKIHCFLSNFPMRFVYEYWRNSYVFRQASFVYMVAYYK